MISYEDNIDVYTHHILYKYISKTDLLFHVVKHEIMAKLINKCICFFARISRSSYSRYVRFS